MIFLRDFKAPVPFTYHLETVFCSYTYVLLYSLENSLRPLLISQLSGPEQLNTYRVKSNAIKLPDMLRLHSDLWADDTYVCMYVHAWYTHSCTYCTCLCMSVLVVLRNKTNWNQNYNWNRITTAKTSRSHCEGAGMRTRVELPSQ